MSSQLNFCSLEDAWNYKPPVKVKGFNINVPIENESKNMDANALYSKFDDMPHFEKQKFMNMLYNTIQRTAKQDYIKKINKPKKEETPVCEPPVNKPESHKKTNENVQYGIHNDTFHFILLFCVGMLLYYIIE